MRLKIYSAEEKKQRHREMCRICYGLMTEVKEDIKCYGEGKSTVALQLIRNDPEFQQLSEELIASAKAINQKVSLIRSLHSQRKENTKQLAEMKLKHAELKHKRLMMYEEAKEKARKIKAQKRQKRLEIQAKKLENKEQVNS